jgi:hypothetical protein
LEQGRDPVHKNQKYGGVSMKLQSFTLRNGFFGGLAFLVLLAAGSNAYARTIKYKGAGAGTFVTAAFTYDGAAPATIFTAVSKDNIGGAENFQCTAEFAPTVTACTAPDKSAGVIFDLVQSDCAGQYTQGQFQFSGTFDTAVGATAGTECISSTTTSAGGSTTYTVTGGEGKLTGASGTFTVTYAGNTLAATGSPPGADGIFGAITFTATGSITTN